MITLFEDFSLESAALYQSLKLAGNETPTIVMEDDGFLPDDIITPYQYFAKYQPTPQDKPKYFNAVPIPKFWEIEGNNESASVNDNGKTRARIQYKRNFMSRIVQNVEWLSEDGKVRAIDHYTKHGIKYAQTVKDSTEKSIFKLYFDQSGHIIIYENYVTGNITLTWNDKEQIFNNKHEFVAYFIDQLEVDASKIIFNSLARPLMVIYNRKQPTQGYLFWQEHVQNELPGNMKTILASQGEREFKVVVPDPIEHARITTMAEKAAQHKVVKSGYLYQYHRKNQYSKQVMIVTNSDQLPNIERIVEQSPDYTFHIAAITEMSSVLMGLGKYRNVKLYPSAEMKTIRRLYEIADVYLDINRGNEILNAVRSAYDYDMLIMGYRETAHNKSFTSSELLFGETEVDKLIEHIHLTKKEKEGLLKKQKAQANEIDKQRFNEALDII